MQVEFIADLHIHSCLSPCAELSMTPQGIVERAAALGINILSVCDHNSVENVEVTKNLAQKKGIYVIPGLEINSSEEVHMLALFGDMDSAMKMQAAVYENLQLGENDEDKFGMQVVVNEHDEVLSFNRRLLIGSTNLTVNKLVEITHELEGIAIASHVDRESFGIIGQLAFIPPDIQLDALEISCGLTYDDASIQYNDYRHIPLVSSSDAHKIEDIGKCTTRFFMYHSTFKELCLSLKGIGGRKVVF